MAINLPSLEPRPDRTALLHQITELLAQGSPGGPTAVGISFDDGDIELAVKPLAGSDIVRALTGFRAPPAWHAFAVVAPATALPLDGGPTRQVVVGVLASRDGSTASALVDDGASHPPTPSDGDGDGRVLDACRRVLGLPTAAPTLATTWWAAMHWVDASLAAVLGADLGHVPSWDELRRLDLGAYHALWPWSMLRADCAAGRVRIPSVDPAGAAWMDDGMFSREALTAYPPLRTMIADLRELLPWSTYEQLLQALCDRLERAELTGVSPA